MIKMPKNFNLLIITANKLRHKYFAIELMKLIPDSYVIIEKMHDETSKNYVEKPTTLIEAHFNEFDETEKKYFLDYFNENKAFFNARLLLEIKKGEINNKENVNFIKEINPTVIAIFSTSLIKDELITLFPKQLINLHAGLSPYYRGSGTNIYPFYNKELEFVGMTIHYLNTGIDSGDIILQGRPKFSINDNTHTIGCKNVILGTELMAKVIKKYLQERSPLPAFKQDISKGKLYLKKDFTEEVILHIRQNLKEGLIKDYLKNRRDVKIISELT
ncbi:MAG: formyl transferase [archaeon]